MKVRATNGLTLRDPTTKRIVPAEGMDVADNDPFWNRLLIDGDAEIVAPIKPAPVVAPKTKE